MYKQWFQLIIFYWILEICCIDFKCSHYTYSKQIVPSKVIGLPGWRQQWWPLPQFRRHKTCRWPWSKDPQRKWQPTPLFLHGESQGQELLRLVALHRVTKRDMTEETMVHAHTQYKKLYRNFPGEPWLGLQAPTVEGSVKSLVWELYQYATTKDFTCIIRDERSCVLQWGISSAKFKKKKIKLLQSSKKKVIIDGRCKKWTELYDFSR